MLFCEYQGLAMRTAEDGQDKVLEGCLGMIGEAGELLDVVKKWKFQSGGADIPPEDKVIEECGDVLWYCAELATGLNESLCSIYDRLYFMLYESAHSMISSTSIDTAAAYIVQAAVRPWAQLYGSVHIMKPDEMWKTALVKVNIAGVMMMIDLFLKKYCNVTLLEAMESNIDKLSKRYPEGFDPERSLHREE